MTWENLLSWFLWAIVWWMLTFFWSVWIFRQQKKSDDKKLKIEKALELLHNINQINALLIDEFAWWYYKLRDLDYYNNKDVFQKLDDLLWRAKVMYYYIFNEQLTAYQDVYNLIWDLKLYFDWVEDLDYNGLEKLWKVAEWKLEVTKNKLENFIK